VIEIVSKIYQKQLWKNKKALEYLHKRGITNKTIKKFQLGYCTHNLAYDKLKNKFSEKELLASGLFDKKDDKVYDIFYSKITIPLIYNDVPVFFTSRAFPENQKLKHMHQRGKTDYAINHDVLSKSNYVFIVEGPIDCMTLSQNGISSIGLLGAFRTSKQIMRDLYNKDIYIVFDSEENNTGLKASKKLAQKLAEYNISSKIVLLPKNGKKEDINSYFGNNSIDNFRKIVKESEVFIPYKRKKFNRIKMNNTIDIVSTAEKYLELKFVGGRYKSLCPFHEDTDPSMVLYEDTNTFYCFGCGRFGNAIALIKKMEELNGNKISNYKAIEIGNRI